MRNSLLLASCMMIFSACGSDSTPVIASLNDQELHVVCEDFANIVCADSVDSCLPDITTCCQQSEIPNSMRSLCVSPVTATDTIDCANDTMSSSPNVEESCVTRMGGCVFDVLDELC